MGEALGGAGRVREEVRLKDDFVGNGGRMCGLKRSQRWRSFRKPQLLRNSFSFDGFGIFYIHVFFLRKTVQ